MTWTRRGHTVPKIIRPVGIQKLVPYKRSARGIRATGGIGFKNSTISHDDRNALALEPRNDPINRLIASATASPTAHVDRVAASADTKEAL
jgi:hypothetical protein